MINFGQYLSRQLDKQPFEYANFHEFTHYINSKEMWKLLRELKSKVKANRVWVLSCWDDNKCKLSETGVWFGDFEIVDCTIKPRIAQYQNIPTSVLWEEWVEAQTNGCNYIEDVTNYEGKLNKVIHLSRDAISYYGTALFCEDNIIGVMGCDWTYANAFDYGDICSIESAARGVNNLINFDDCELSENKDFDFNKFYERVKEKQKAYREKMNGPKQKN